MEQFNTLVSIGACVPTHNKKYTYVQPVKVWRVGTSWTIGSLCKRASCDMLDFLPNDFYLGGEDGWKRSFRTLKAAHVWLNKRANQHYGTYEVG